MPAGGRVVALCVLAVLAWSTAGSAGKPAGDDGEVLLRLPGRWSWSDGQRIAYLDAEGAVRLLDPLANVSSLLVPPGEGVEDLRLAGDHLAFLAGPGLKDLRAGPLAGPHLPVADAPGQLAPALHEDGSLAWVDTRDGHLDVWMREPGQAPRAVTQDAAGQFTPAIDAGFVAWTDARNASPLLQGTLALAHPSNLDVFVVDRRIGAVLQVADEPFEQVQPALAGGRVAYLSQAGGAYALVHRDAQQGIRGAPAAAGDAGWRPLLIEGHGDGLAVLEGTTSEARLHVVDLALGSWTSVGASIPNAVSLSADRGIAAVGTISADGGHEVLVLRLPSVLRPLLAADGEGCWRVTAQGAQGDVRAFHAQGLDVVALEPTADGQFRACGGGTVRLADEQGASPAVPLADATPAKGSPAATPALAAALALAVAAYRRRR